MAMKARYTVINGEVISEKRGANHRTYVPDANGNTVALVDDGGTVTDTFTYWPYGEVKSRTGTTPTPFQFGGTNGYYNDATGRSYVRARHLRAPLGGWLTVDPLWPTEPAYQYCQGSPTTFVDPSGMMLVSLATNLLPRPFPKIRPDRVSLWDNCCEALKRQFSGDFFGAMNALWFKRQVEDNGPWDFKRNSPLYEEFGNYHFGFVAACANFSLYFALVQAGKNQIGNRRSDPKWQPRRPRRPRSASSSLAVFAELTPLMWPYGDDPRDARWIEHGYLDALASMAAIKQYCDCRDGNHNEISRFSTWCPTCT